MYVMCCLESSTSRESGVSLKSFLPLALASFLSFLRCFSSDLAPLNTPFSLHPPTTWTQRTTVTPHITGRPSLHPSSPAASAPSPPCACKRGLDVQQ